MLCLQLQDYFCAVSSFSVRVGRPPGISRNSPVFQRALQLATIAFSPDVRHPPLPAPPALPCRGSTSHRVFYQPRRPTPPRTTATTAAAHDQLSRPPYTRRAATSCTRARRDPPRRAAAREKGRSGLRNTPRPQLFGDFTLAQTGGGDGEEGVALGEPLAAPPEPLRMATAVDGTAPMAPASMLAALQPAKLFDSGDMIMAAGLLDHPESSLKVQ